MFVHACASVRFVMGTRARSISLSRWSDRPGDVGAAGSQSRVRTDPRGGGTDQRASGDASDVMRWQNKRVNNNSENQTHPEVLGAVLIIFFYLMWMLSTI